MNERTGCVFRNGFLVQYKGSSAVAFKQEGNCY
jgi:hypothetical protein